MMIRRFKYWLLAVAAVVSLGMGSAWAGDLEDGLAALKAKNYEKALQLLRPVASKGNAVAQRYVGFMHESGFGVKQDHDEAARWYQKAADQGDAAGQYSLGWSYYSGKGVANDFGRALAWFRLSADQGHAGAQIQLALMLRDGIGVARSYEEALRWFNVAAARGNASAQANIAYMHESGFGVKQDYDEAARWYLKASALGNEFAKKKLESTWAMRSAAERVAAVKGNPGKPVQDAAKKDSSQQEKEKEKERTRLADEARAREQERLAQVAKAKEKDRLAQDERTRNELMASARQRDEEVVQLRQQLAKLQDEKTGKDQKTVFATRRALVIGNDSYRQVTKLINAREDARAIAASLQQVGYQVTLGLDLNEKDMKAALRTFKGQVEGGDEVLVYFAGHGVQLGAANYLLPVDISSENEDQIKDDSIQLQRILDDMSERKAKFTLAMIDACRDNPFKTVNRAIGGRGLAPTTAATGQMVIFSAGAGQQALDKLGPADKNRNGLFTRVFLKEMQKPGISVDKVVRNVRSEVVALAKSVGHEQVPAIYDQVVGEFYFRR